jgi:hypothetical protein
VAARHDPRAFAFSGGELAQVYARDLRESAEAPLVYLAPGEADRVREDCRAGHLICPVPGCDAPAFWASGGSSRRRHHFRHRHVPVGAHAPESYFHLVGKHAVAAWLRRSHPEAAVEVEAETSDRSRRADVLAVFPDERRFAFEIQYAPITAGEWAARHESYRAQGIQDIWLFGHTPSYLRIPRQEWLEGRVQLNETLLAVRAAGYRVRFLNPDELTIASQLIELDESWHAERHPLVQVDSLASCRIESARLITPTDATEIAVFRARRERERREADAKRRREAERGSWRRRGEAERAQAWRRFEPEFLARVGLAATPAIVATEQKGDRGIFMHPAHWHALVWLELHGRRGETISFNTIARGFAARQPRHTEYVWKTLAAYLFRLRRAGYLYVNNDWSFIYDCVPLAELAGPPSEALRRACSQGDVWLARDQDRLVAVGQHGEVLSDLRDARESDELPELTAWREQQARERTLPPAFPVSPDTPPLLAARIAEQKDTDDAFTIEIPAAVFTTTLKAQLRSTVRAYPGDQRVRIVVAGAVPGFDRVLEWPERIDAGPALHDAVELVLHGTRELVS